MHLRPWILLSGLILAGCTVCSGADFCAVTVTVVAPNGLRIPGPVPVALVDSSGAVVEQTVLRDGEASFCDFGFGEHSVIIGGEVCGSVVVRHIRLQFGLSQEFKVIKNTCKGDGDGGRLNCAAYLRIRSDTGQRLGHAELWTMGKYWRQADEYGRVEVIMLNGTTEDYEVRSPGYQRQEIHLSCRRNDEIQREVILHRE